MGLNELKKKYGIENGQKTTTAKDSGFSTDTASGSWTSGSDTIDSLKQKYGISQQSRVTFSDANERARKRAEEEQSRDDALRLANGQKLLYEVDMARLNTAKRIQQRNEQQSNQVLSNPDGDKALPVRNVVSTDDDPTRGINQIGYGKYTQYKPQGINNGIRINPLTGMPEDTVYKFDDETIADNNTPYTPQSLINDATRQASEDKRSAIRQATAQKATQNVRTPYITNGTLFGEKATPKTNTEAIRQGVKDSTVLRSPGSEAYRDMMSRAELESNERYVNDADRTLMQDYLKVLGTSKKSGLSNAVTGLDAMARELVRPDVNYGDTLNSMNGYNKYQALENSRNSVIESAVTAPNNQSGFRKIAIEEAQSMGVNLPGQATNLLTTLLTGNPILGNKVGAVVLGLQMAGSAYNESRGSGHTTEQSLRFALEQGVEEAVTDAIIGLPGAAAGGTALGKKVVQKVGTLGKSATGKWIAKAIAGMAVNGANEFAQETLQYYTENLSKQYLLGDDVTYNTEDALHAGFMGLVNALVMGAGYTAAGYAGAGLNALEYGTTATGSGDIASRAVVAREVADSIDTDAKNYRDAESYIKAQNYKDLLEDAATTLENGKELSDFQKGGLVEAEDTFLNIGEDSYNENGEFEKEPPLIDRAKSLVTDTIDRIKTKDEAQVEAETETRTGAKTLDENKLAESLDNEGKTLVKNVIDEYKGTNTLSSKVLGMREVYTASRYNMSDVESMYHNGDRYGLTADEVNRAIKAGVSDRVAEMRTQNQIAAVKPGLTKDSYKYSELTREQKNTLDAIGKRTHVKIMLDATMDINENASWNRSTRTMRINPKTKELTGSVLHELTHYLRDTDIKSYTEYRDAVVNFLAGREGTDGESFLEEKIKSYTDRYEGHTKKSMSRDAIIDEIVSDGAMDFFNDDNVVAQYAKNKGFVQKIVDFFNDIVESVRTYLGDSQGNSISRELKSDLDEYVKIRDKWMAALEKSANASENAKGNAPSYNDDVEYSLVGYTSDGTEVYETSDSIKALTYKERMAKFVDIMENDYRGRTAKFIRNGHSYYAKFGSSDVRKNIYGDKLSDEKGWKNKISEGAGGAIFDLVENSKYNGSLKETGKTTGIHTSTNFWDYFVKTVQINGKVYDLVANVRKGNDGEFVYSLQLNENKNKKAAPLTSSRVLSRATTDNKVSQDVENVNTDENGSSYSLTTDSTGKQLTEGQKKYFKDSKVVDDNGRLLKLYHGTPSGGFTVFRDWAYLSPDKEYAARYMNPGASSIRFGKTATNPEVYEVYANAKKLFDTRKAKDRRIFMNEYFRHYGNGTPLMESGLPDWTDGEDLIEFFEDNDYDYDGIILDEGADGGYGDKVVKRGFSYLIKGSSQIKNTDNENPTDNPDIRFSLNADNINNFTNLYTVLEDGRIKPNSLKDLSTEDWKIIYKTVNKLGYGLESVKQAKEVFSRYVGENGFNKEQSEAIKKAYGVAEKNTATFNPDRVKAAKKEYGVTSDFREAGYLLPDGYMLDFSGKKEGGPAHVRYMDHREIARVFGDEEVETRYGDNTAYMNKFISEGNIRLMDGQGITLGEIEPTPKQYTILKRFIDYVIGNEDYFYLDLSNNNGNTVESRDYSSNDTSSKIIRDIKEYYKNGELPYRSELQQFRYSLNVDDYHQEGTAAYNEAKAEQDKSILRRMLDVTDSDNDYISTAYTELQMANKAVGELLSNTHFMPAKKSIEYRAKKLIEQTNSARNRDEVVQKLSTLYEYIYNSDHVDGDMVSTVATDIADWLMSDEKPVYDEQEVKNYNGFKSLLKGRTFKLGDADWVNLDTARARHFFGTLRVGRTKGSYIDEVWSELCDEAKEFNVILDDSIANPVDMVNELMDKLEDKPQPVRDGRDEADWKRDVYMTGQSILDEYFRTKFRSDQDAVNKLLAMYRTNINEYVNRKTKSLSDQYKARYTRYRERENSKAARNSIIKNSKELARMLATPTNAKHIPEAFRAPVANFLKNIDFASEDFYTTGNVTQRTNDWLKLQQVVNEVINSNASTITGSDGQQYYISLDPSLSEKMGNLSQKLESTVRIDDLSRKELFELRDTIVSIKKCIENANTMIGDEQKRKVSDFGNGTINELGKIKDKKEFNSMLGGFINLTQNHMLDAQTRFHTFGEHAEEVLKEVREGFNKKVQYVRDASDYVSELKEKLDVSDTEINAWRDKGFIKATIGGKEYTFRQDYVMSLYELMKRPQAREHILKGGITPTPFETEDNVAKKIVKRLYKPGNIKVTAADVNGLISQLSQKQKDFADGLTKYFLKAAEWGNKASMEAYGYRKFTDSNYFPIKTNADYRDSNTKDIMGDGTQAIRNLGMTKAVVPHANNPIMLESIMDVFTNHIEQMSSYSGFLVPLDDVQKWYNYRPIDGNGMDAYTKTVKTEIDRAYGKGANEYVKKFLKDINGTSQNERYIGKDLISHFKGSAVGFNLSVAIQQPTAYVRAVAVMNPKYLTKALTVKSDTDMDTIKQYSSIAQWKDWGFFDINVGKSMQSIIIGNTKAMDKVRDAQMWLAGKGDEVTWKQLWKAAELQVDEEQPNLTKRSDEYYTAVAEVFDNVIDRTQVVDSVFHRTDIMRSKNDLTQMATSFMSEPMKSYNMIYRAAYDYAKAKGPEKAKASKALTASASAFVLSAVFSAAAKSVITAMRKSGADRDKDWWERYKEAFTDEVLSNINPIEYVPLVKDIASIWDGYSVARSDMQWAQDLKYAWSRWEKTFNGEGQYTIASNILYSLKPLSDLTGIATYALQRDINAVIDTALEITGADKAEYLKYRAFGKKIGQKNASVYIRLAENAYIKGNTALGDQIVNDMVNAGVDESKLKTINKEREWISLGGTLEDYQAHKEALKSIRDENSGDDIKPAIIDYINAFDGTEEQKRTLWVLGGYGETTYDKTFNTEPVKEEASTEPQKTESPKTEKKSETSKAEKKTEAKKTLADEIEAKDVENKYSYVIESKDYSNQEKVEWLLSDSDKTSSKKYTGWKAVGGSDYDYIKHRSDLEKFSGDDKQEKVVRYIKNQTNDADRQKALWNMAGYKDSTFGKFFN